jgi:hypothetical protein
LTQLINLGLMASRSPQDAGIPDPSAAEPGALSQSGFTFAQQFELNLAALKRQDSTDVDSHGSAAASGNQIGNQSGKQLPVLTAIELPATAYVQRLPSGTPVVLGEALADEKTLKDFAALQGMNADALAVLFGRYSSQGVRAPDTMNVAEVDQVAETVAFAKDTASVSIALNPVAESLPESLNPIARPGFTTSAGSVVPLPEVLGSFTGIQAGTQVGALIGPQVVASAGSEPPKAHSTLQAPALAATLTADLHKVAAVMAAGSPAGKDGAKGISEVRAEKIGQIEIGSARVAQAQPSQTAVPAPATSASSTAAVDVTSLVMPLRFRQQAVTGLAAETPPPSEPLKLAVSAKVAPGDVLSKPELRASTDQAPTAALSAGLANAPGLAPKPLRSQPVMSGAAFTLSAEHITETLRVQSGTSAAPAAPEASTAAAPSHAVLLEDLPNKLSEMVAQRLMANIRGGAWRFDLQLHPQELGTLDVQMEMRDGRLEAQISTSSAAVKEFLGSQLQRLDDSLNAAGFKGSSIDVALHQGRSDNGSQGERRGHPDGSGATESDQEQTQSPSSVSDSSATAGLDLFV